MNSKIKIVALCIAACGSVPAAAQPQTVVTGQPERSTGYELVTALVPYRDLNLAAPAGVAALNERVAHAASRLCFSSGLQPVRWQMAERRCRDEAIAGAQGQIAQAIDAFGQLADRGGTIRVLARR